MKRLGSVFENMCVKTYSTVFYNSEKLGKNKIFFPIITIFNNHDIFISWPLGKLLKMLMLLYYQIQKANYKIGMYTVLPHCVYIHQVV